MAKIAITGLSRFSLFPVIANDTGSYEAGEKFELPWISELSREADVSETPIYGDDMLYANVKAWNGLKVTITLLEIPLEMMDKLGFGTYNKDTGTLKANPQGKNLEFAATFRAQQMDGGFRMFKYFSLVVNELKESGLKTKGDGTEVSTYQLIGTFTARKFDDVPYEIHDGTDITWLDTIDSMPEQ